MIRFRKQYATDDEPLGAVFLAAAKNLLWAVVPAILLWVAFGPRVAVAVVVGYLLAMLLIWLYFRATRPKVRDRRDDDVPAWMREENR